MQEKNTTKNVLSLFSGCGGMDLGIEGGFEVLEASINNLIHSDWILANTRRGWGKLPRTCFSTVFANDIRKDAMNTWVNYFSKRGTNPNIYKLESIVDIVKRAKMDNDNLLPIGVDIVTGGFPCQDFSVAGKRLGFDSDKGHDGKHMDVDSPSIENRGLLYIWMREVISMVRPKMFIAENVKGLVNYEDAKEIIQNDFSSVCGNGYIVVSPKVLHSGNYGVPQTRERVLFIGFLKSALRPEAIEALSADNVSSEYDPYPVPTHYINEIDILRYQNNNLLPAVTVGQALRGLNEPEDELHDLSQKGYSKAKWMGKHCQGQIEVNWHGLAPTIRSEHHGNIEFRRLSIEHGGKLTTEQESGLSERRLTVRECARLQTFPDDYEFVIEKADRKVSPSSAYKLVGNAVPPLLAYHVVKRIESLWDIYFI